MFFVVLPLSFIDGTTSVVKGSLPVPLTLNKIPVVLIALGSIYSPCYPDMCAMPMLA